MTTPQATSSAAAFKLALLTALQADANLADVQVESTYPGDTLRAIAMYYGKTSADVTTPVSAGPARVKRQEDYTVEILIDVATGMADVPSAEDAALGILGELDNVLATTPTMGILGGGMQVWLSYVSKWEIRPYMDDTRQGWAVLLTANVIVKARLA